VKTKNLPAKLLAVIGIFFSLGIICPAMVASVPALDPVRYVEANATATAIAPSIYPTLQYNENVLPELQRVEREEISATTRNAQAWRRNVDQAVGVAKIVAVGSFALACVGVGVGVGGFAGARGVREMRQSALPPTRILIEGPHITEHGTITHTVTGATWNIDTPQDARPDHARLIAPTYKAIPRDVLLELLRMQRIEWERVGEQRLLT